MSADKIKLKIETGIFGGNPRTWHGNQFGEIEISHDATVGDLQQQVQAKAKEPIKIRDYDASASIKGAGLKHGDTVRAVFSSRMD